MALVAKTTLLSSDAYHTFNSQPSWPANCPTTFVLYEAGGSSPLVSTWIETDANTGAVGVD